MSGNVIGVSINAWDDLVFAMFLWKAPSHFLMLSSGFPNFSLFNHRIFYDRYRKVTMPTFQPENKGRGISKNKI